MKRMAFGTALAVGCILLAGGSATAQETHRGGWPREGDLGWSTTQPQQMAPAMIPENTVTDSRFNYHNNRWWYWTAEHKLKYWTDGQWKDYTADSASTPRASNDQASTDSNDLSGWYWRNSEKRWYLFDGKTLKLAP